MASCFDGCSLSRCGAHLDGAWVRRSQPLYSARFDHILRSLGVRGEHSNYGRCDDPRVLRAVMGNGSQRPTFRWEASRCGLREYTVHDACTLLRGKSVMVVGDSTAAQLWFSLGIQLGAVFGRNSRVVSDVDEAVASACNDTVRLVFSRNDLLILNPKDFSFFKRLDVYVKLHAFSERASRDADILLVSIGHHFPSFIRHLTERFGAHMPPNAFFHLNLNRTLSQLVHRRGHWKHHPSSIILLSSVVPVPGCRRFSEPLSLAQSLFAQSAAIDPEFQELRLFWDGVLKQNTISQWLATVHGASFLDITPLSLMRPDGQMARFSSKNDCLHSCMPGPVDTWVQLAFNLLASWGDGMMRLPTPTHGLRFFEVDSFNWTKRRGVGTSLESCDIGDSTCWAVSKQLKPLFKDYSWLFTRRSKTGAIDNNASRDAMLVHMMMSRESPASSDSANT